MAAASAPGAVYAGRGFDACSTPSEAQMAAWRASRYRAIGVYIGGTNMACSQPNLTAGWVSAESAAGWHLIPTYVGLQAPGNSCGCAGIDPRRASSEGAAAANDAVAQAQALGLGPGNPIYFDMEYYATGGTSSSAVLRFLAAWTARLHAGGYKSGVYGNADSAISDLAARMGTRYPEPDDIWFAEWNGELVTSSSYIPSGDWAAHQRLHQYDGGHDETHRGVTINIDGDYLDGATAAAGTALAAPPAVPVSSAPPLISGIQGRTLTERHGTWSGKPSTYAYQWEDCDPTGASCSRIPGATGRRYTLGASDVGHTIRVQEAASNAAGSGAPATSAATAPVQPPSVSSPWDVSPPSITGNPQVGETLSATPGSWSGKQPISYTYQWQRCAPGCADIAGATLPTYTPSSGDAAARVQVSVTASNTAGSSQASSGEAGPVTIPGGYWLYSARGNVYEPRGTPWYGSPVAAQVDTSAIVGMAATLDGKGYWLATSTGAVYAYGDAAALPTPAHGQPIAGIVASPAGGYWLYSARGNVYEPRGTPWYGSPVAAQVRDLRDCRDGRDPRWQGLLAGYQHRRCVRLWRRRGAAHSSSRPADRWDRRIARGRLLAVQRAG